MLFTKMIDFTFLYFTTHVVLQSKYHVPESENNIIFYSFIRCLDRENKF